jgi:hypothetical protein
MQGSYLKLRPQPLAHGKIRQKRYGKFGAFYRMSSLDGVGFMVVSSDAAIGPSHSMVRLMAESRVFTSEFQTYHTTPEHDWFEESTH